jgi:hypothetical protein
MGLDNANALKQHRKNGSHSRTNPAPVRFAVLSHYRGTSKNPYNLFQLQNHRQRTILKNVLPLLASSKIGLFFFHLKFSTEGKKYSSIFRDKALEGGWH